MGCVYNNNNDVTLLLVLVLLQALIRPNGTGSIGEGRAHEVHAEDGSAEASCDAEILDSNVAL